MWEGEVVSVNIASASEAAPVAVPEATAVAGRGLEGDRYFDGTGTFSRRHDPSCELTLIEAEAIAGLAADYGVDIAPGAARRNIVTRGVALNHLVGRDFYVGEVRVRGLELCEPCGHLERLTVPGVKRGLVHRGGLRAQIVTGGVIRPGDRVTPARDGA